MERDMIKNSSIKSVYYTVAICLILLFTVCITTSASYAAEGSGNPDDIIKTRQGVVNGKISFDKSTGTIVSSSKYVMEVTIPSEIEGVEVKAIGSRAFSDREFLYRVELPGTIEKLGVNCFANCDMLKEIFIPKSVESTSSDIYNLFSNLDNITKYVISAPPEEIKEISDMVIKGFKKYIKEIEEEMGNEVIANWESIVQDYTLNTILDYLEMYDISLPAKELNSLVGYVTFAIELEGDIKEAENLASGPFLGCDNLNKIEFEDGIESIPAFILFGCGGIEKVNLPDSVKTIESYAFARCKKLVEVNLPKNLVTLEVNSFENSDLLGEIHIPKTLQEAGGCSGSPFNQCDGLKKVVFKEGIKEIPPYILQKVKSIENVIIPEGVTSIGDFAFYNCSGLSKVELPESLTELGLECFGYCPKLKEIKFNGVLTKTGGINASPFENSGINKVTFVKEQETVPQHMFTRCNNLVEITIPEGITSIGNHAFYQCEKLSQVNFPSTLTTLGLECFGYCPELREVKFNGELIKTGGTNAGPFEKSGLQKVEFSQKQKAIPSNMFSMCSNITEIDIPENITSIKNYAFSSCTNLKIVNLLNESTNIEKNAFYSTKNVEIIKK